MINYIVNIGIYEVVRCNSSAFVFMPKWCDLVFCSDLWVIFLAIILIYIGIHTIYLKIIIENINLGIIIVRNQIYFTWDHVMKNLF